MYADERIVTQRCSYENLKLVSPKLLGQVKTFNSDKF